MTSNYSKYFIELQKIIVANSSLFWREATKTRVIKQGVYLKFWTLDTSIKIWYLTCEELWIKNALSPKVHMMQKSVGAESNNPTVMGCIIIFRPAH